MIRVAIVGGGPNCTYALERLAALAGRHPRASPVHIQVFDRSGCFGSGAVHDPKQSPFNYLNRVASQIAFGADESIAAKSDLLPKERRPSFHQWAMEKARDGDARFKLRPTDVPKRYLHGLALQDAFSCYLAKLRAQGARVECIAEEVVDLWPEPAGGFELKSSEGRTHQASFILLVTGHGDNACPPGHAPNHIAQPYPVDRQLSEAATPPTSICGVAGMGLTAIDVILQLTEGRGGTFESIAGRSSRLRYRRSGREPGQIVPFCESGLFTFCRGLNQKAVDGSGRSHCALEHQPVFLTHGAVEQRRSVRGTLGSAGGESRRQLDFERDIFPLIVLEMALVFHSAANPQIRDRLIGSARPRYERFLEGVEPRSSADWLVEPIEHRARSLCPANLGFDWREVFSPLAAKDAHSPENWKKEATAFLSRDLDDSQEGNLTNPRKAAIDAVWRDLRSVLSDAIDFGGLTPSSHRDFINGRLRDYNRLSNGGGIEAMEKILALIEAGLVNLSIGPSPALRKEADGKFELEGAATGARVTLDHLIEGRAHVFDAMRDRSPLYRNLIRRGLVRLWANEGNSKDQKFIPGGLDVTRDRHPKGRDGAVDERITILGAPIERVAFFQLTAARPFSGSQSVKLLDAWARDVLNEIDQAVAAEPCHA